MKKALAVIFVLLLTAIAIAQQSVSLPVSETFLFSQTKLDALNMRAQDKTDVAALCPAEIKLIDGRHALLVFANGRAYDTDRARLDAALAAYTVNDPVEGPRGVLLGDLYITPPPASSVPLDGDRVVNEDGWRSQTDRNLAASAFGVTTR